MITYYFGNPGCGKTTLATKIASRSRLPVYHNIPELNLGFYIDNITDLGLYTIPPNSLLLIDESSIVFNNRLYKSFPKHCIEWFKLHRHYKVDIVIFSQSWEDTDITIRRLTDKLFYIKRLGKLPLSFVRKLRKTVIVDEQTHQIVDGYKFVRALSRFVPILGDKESLRFISLLKYRKFFNSYFCKPLPFFDAEERSSI